MRLGQILRNNPNPYRLARKVLWRLSMLGLARGPHVTRYAMYRRLREIAPLLSQKTGRALSISHSGVLGELLGLNLTEVVAANYPEHNMLALDFADDSFDFVFSNQVLEHVEGDPYAAIAECRRVLKIGGIAIHTTCFINPIHGSPNDFWRFSPEALRLLHADWEVIECGGWGNLSVWNIAADNMRYEGVPHAKWHPLHWIAIKNDPLWPISTWVVARKRDAATLSA